MLRRDPCSSSLSGLQIWVTSSQTLSQDELTREEVWGRRAFREWSGKARLSQWYKQVKLSFSPDCPRIPNSVTHKRWEPWQSKGITDTSWAPWPQNLLLMENLPATKCQFPVPSVAPEATLTPTVGWLREDCRRGYQPHFPRGQGTPFALSLDTYQDASANIEITSKSSKVRRHFTARSDQGRHAGLFLFVCLKCQSWSFSFLFF
jgi:hypothetical protein